MAVAPVWLKYLHQVWLRAHGNEDVGDHDDGQGY